MTKRRTLRGQFVEGTATRLILDDGRLNHGHKIINFIVSGDPSASANDAYAVLSLDYDSPTAWDWSDNRQIAWAASPVDSVGSIHLGESVVDPDHIVLQDLWINGVVGSSGGSSVINYLVELELVELSNDQSILTLIKERSQDDLR